MQNVIFLGTDLHNEPSELAAKLVRDLSSEFKDSKMISIQNRKPWISNKKCLIVPRIFNNRKLRKITQGLLLPIYLTFNRPTRPNLMTFWTVSGKYHSFLLAFAQKVLRYKIIFTVISGYDKDYSALRFCDLIVCQSNKMHRHLKQIFLESKLRIIPPWTNTSLFAPAKKEYDLLIPSIPYKIADFKERGIDEVMKFLKKSDLNTKVLFRSTESYEYFKSLGLRNVELINKVLSYKELSDLMSGARLIPLLYSKGSPDMPLSAIEGLACGCAVVTTKDIGLGEMLEENECGVVFKTGVDLSKVLKKSIENKKYGLNARKTALKYFHKKNLAKYSQLIKN